MSDIRVIDFRLIDDVFAMEKGYVLDFSDRTIRLFFADELNIDIDAPTYQIDGTSKAKRLRCMLRAVDNPTAIRVLKALWEYRLAAGRFSEEGGPQAEGRFLQLIHRLDGGRAQEKDSPASVSNVHLFAKLKKDLVDLWGLPPQQRGYAFESFLKSAFDMCGMRGRDSFRLRGEQIDGSFELDHATYLVEAKWEASQIGAADLRSFEGKVTDKAAWSRGLFVSYSGFSKDGLYAFGRGKRTICMSGEDFDEALKRELLLDHVIRLKTRRASETGLPYVPLRELV